jgi:hypothetical protein
MVVITIFFYHGLMLPPVYRVSQRIVALVNNNNCYSWFIDWQSIVVKNFGR